MFVRRAGARRRAVHLAAWSVAVVAVAATARAVVPLVSGIAVAVLVPAAVVDLRERRLPDRIVAPAGAVLVVGTVTTQLSGTALPFASGFAGVVVFAGPLVVIHLISPAAMGFGDVKAAVVLGFALGLVHWQLALATLALATGATAAAGLLSRARTIALGPGLVAASALALAAAPIFAPLDAPAGATPVLSDHPSGEHR